MKESEMAAIPHLFRCPISLDLFTDPVTLCTGQTYERSSIERWLAAGNLTCPVTMQRLHDPTFVPNHTLRHLIDQWIHSEDHGSISYNFNSVGVDDPCQSFVSLKHVLESRDGTFKKKIRAMGRIHARLEEFPPVSSFLIKLGFVPLLLGIVFERGGYSEEEQSHDKMKFLEQAMACALKLLARSGVGALNEVEQSPILESLQNLFKHGNEAIKVSACQLIELISSSPKARELCEKIGKTREILQQIVLLLFHQKDNVCEAGVKAIASVCSISMTPWSHRSEVLAESSLTCSVGQTGMENLILEGAMDGLIEYLIRLERDRREGHLMALGVTTIERLLGIERGKEALLNHRCGVTELVRMVFQVSNQEGSESAVSSLAILCSDNFRVREDAINAGLLSQLLLLLQSQCSARTKAKARMLLKVLR